VNSNEMPNWSPSDAVATQSEQRAAGNYGYGRAPAVQPQFPFSIPSPQPDPIAVANAKGEWELKLEAQRGQNAANLASLQNQGAINLAMLQQRQVAPSVQPQASACDFNCWIERIVMVAGAVVAIYCLFRDLRGGGHTRPRKMMQNRFRRLPSR